MVKGSKRCRCCSRTAVGYLLFQDYSYRDHCHKYSGGGYPLCHEHLEIATHSNYSARLRATDLVLMVARRAA